MLRLSCWAALAAAVSLVPAGAQVTLRGPAPVVVQSGDSLAVPFVVANTAGKPAAVRVAFTVRGGSVAPAAVALKLPPHGWQVVSTHVRLAAGAAQAAVALKAGTAAARCVVARGIDLGALPWRRKALGATAPLDSALAAPDLDDRAWTAFRAPALWEEKGFTVCRARLTIPAAWRGVPLRIRMGAVDDGDVTFLNGVRLGSTNGWDVPRHYDVPAEAVRWGAENVLTVAVRNDNAGGGLSKPPYLLLAGTGALPEEAQTPAAPPRPAPGKIGAPEPFRRMTVRDGVLRYADGGEVALWGSNYYPQSWWQFENMHAVKADMKAAIDRDLYDMQRMGVQVIRIHVFDTEISDLAGNLVRNEHLDLLDYVLHVCRQRGIYVYLTPIAWWWSPGGRPDAFSANTSKPGMMFSPRALSAETRYLRDFLTHTNPYTGTRLINEPHLCLLEVQNEPAYFTLADIESLAYEPQGERPAVIERDRVEWAGQWRAWLAAHRLTDNPAWFPLFRYDRMRAYIRRVIAAVRATGARQPIAISSFNGSSEDLAEAIGDSECDATTFTAYPGGWARINDGTNLLPEMGVERVNPALARKARLVYEFDAPATNTSCYLYPAIAAHFRSMEAQVACQFQYDSLTTARWNTDWNAHWLNRYYTPRKAASFLAAGQLFQAEPRGVRYDQPADSLRLMWGGSSFSQNTSFFNSSTTYIASAPENSFTISPFSNPPKRVVAVGDCPYARYDGTGYYDLEWTGRDEAVLEITPDCTLVGSCLTSGFGKPVAELAEREHRFALVYPEWKDAALYRHTAEGWREVAPDGEGWLLLPGRYALTWRGAKPAAWSAPPPIVPITEPARP